jgi:Zn-dependent protease with chaperone function/tetratricopeptide (TPR) repeat protein
MTYVSFLRIAVFVALFLFSAVAQPPSRDPAEENPVIEELSRAAKPETVESFKTATEALDSGRFEEAETQYREVLKQAPDFEPAMRRLGYALVALGRKAEGLELTKKALDRNRSVENLVGRASSLLSSNDPQYQPTQAEKNEALLLGREAWQKSGSADEGSAVLVAETLLMSDKIEEFKSFARTLKTALPNSARAAYYSAIVLAEDGDLDGAEAEIARSKQLGAPDETVEPLLSAIRTTRDEAFFGLGRFRNYGYIAAVIVGLWALGLGALFFVGRHLSSKTLKSIEESDPNDITGSAFGSLKKLYRRVVSIAGVYYYVSQPFVIFLVIVVTLAVILGFLWIGTIPIKLLLIFAFVGAATIFYMIKSLVTRVKVEDPGRVLTEAEAPGLWRLVRDVAVTINTRPADEIRITPGTDLAVYERGSFRAKMSDNADRILILGTAVLNGFDQNAFRAVLAHEYGHFSNRDTAGGDIAFRVENDIIRTAESMAASGTATFYNLGFQFLRLFHFLFRRITYGASRLQEILADRVAAYHFGPEAFNEGLKHVVRRQVEFSHVANKEINEALSGQRALQNLYEMGVPDESAKKEVEDAFKTAFERPTTHDDTHPSPQDRFRFIKDIRPVLAEELKGNVWELFADRAAITAEMNDILEKLVRPNYQNQEGSILGIG